MIFNKLDRERAIIFIDSLFAKDKSIKIDYVKQVKTLSQNNYFWLICTHVGFETGATKNDMYEYVKAKHSPVKEIDLNGSIASIPITLSAMTKEQCTAFINAVVIDFRQEGFDVPDPDNKRCVEMYDYYRSKGMM